jgi:hypothetical protein
MSKTLLDFGEYKFKHNHIIRFNTRNTVMLVEYVDESESFGCFAVNPHKNKQVHKKKRSIGSVRPKMLSLVLL